MRLYLVALHPTNAVTYGYLPAAAELGLDITVLTDQPEAHAAIYAAEGINVTTVATNPRDARAILNTVTKLGTPDALFTNSDTVQSPVALAADFLDLPAKPWRGTALAKNKWLMRCALADVDPVFAYELGPSDEIAELLSHPLPYPLILKPTEGVASEEVVRATTSEELRHLYAAARSRRPAESFLVEQELSGQMRTLEVLRDRETTVVFGGFRARFSKPPYFIEENFEWVGGLPVHAEKAVLSQLDTLGCDFGWFHIELAYDGHRARIVEVNDRIIGGHLGVLMTELFGVSTHGMVLRTFLGEPLPATAPAPRHTHALAEYVVANRSGTVTKTPAAVDIETSEFLLRYRPMKPVGFALNQTHSNRDKLGVFRVVGSDRQQMRAAVAQFQSEHDWVVR